MIMMFSFSLFAQHGAVGMTPKRENQNIEVQKEIEKKISLKYLKTGLNKKLPLVCGMQFLSGAFDGMNQMYLFHYYDYVKIFPNSVPNTEAWKNKWAKDDTGAVIVGKEKFLGSSTFLVWTQDPHHLTRTSSRFLDAGSALVYSLGAKKKKWYFYILDFSTSFAARTAGFYSTYVFLPKAF